VLPIIDSSVPFLTKNQSLIPPSPALATTTTPAISIAEIVATDDTTTLLKLLRVQWNTQMIEVIIEELLHQVKLGKRADSGFKKETRVAVCAMVQTVTTQPLIELQCKTKMETLKDLERDSIGFLISLDLDMMKKPS
jgi:Myb/SANT-like DNA-binding domain